MLMVIEYTLSLLLLLAYLGCIWKCISVVDVFIVLYRTVYTYMLGTAL